MGVKGLGVGDLPSLDDLSHIYYLLSSVFMSHLKEELARQFRLCCIYRLAYLEIKDKVYTQQQLMEVAIKHYRSQVNLFSTL